MSQEPEQSDMTGFWSRGCRGAISLTFDDAASTHVQNAIPVLDRHGLRGTFYVTYTSPKFPPVYDDWRAAHARGHEIGNHSRRHPCSCNFHFIGDNALEDYT